MKIFSLKKYYFSPLRNNPFLLRDENIKIRICWYFSKKLDKEDLKGGGELWFL